MSKYHHNRLLFLEAIKYTANEFNFSETLIEKDYYCSLILKEISQLEDCNLIFKGWTSLSKIHAGFYRLSEDLDFSINIEHGASRKERKLLADSGKKFIKNAIHRLSFRSLKPFEGKNENRLYTSEVEYESLMSLLGMVEIPRLQATLNF